MSYYRDHGGVDPAPERSPRHAYKGKPGYSNGRPWFERVKTWTSRDGRVTQLRDLVDSHLENIILFLRRRADKAIAEQQAGLLLASIFISSEHALDALEHDMTINGDTTNEDLCSELPIYRALCREADRRAAALGLVPAIDTPVYNEPNRRRPLHAIERDADRYILDDGWGSNDGWGITDAENRR